MSDRDGWVVVKVEERGCMSIIGDFIWVFVILWGLGCLLMVWAEWAGH